MATPDARDDAFIREVDDEYRRARLEGYWRRYGRIIAISVLVFLAVLAAALYWREDRARSAGVTGERFSLALTQIDSGNTAAAAPVLADLAKASAPGYRAAALLEASAIAVQAGDAAKGLAGYRAIAADTTLAAPFRDLATIKATRIEYDSLPPATVIARLKPFTVPGDPWFAVASEMTGIAKLKLGEREAAATLFAAVVRDTAAPQSIRNRAAQLAIGLGTDPAPFVMGQTQGLAR